MNPENLNNDGNIQPQNFEMPTQPDMTSQNLGNFEQPVAAQPEFTPFENLNSEALNVPQDTFNPTPVDPSTFNAEVTNEINNQELNPTTEANAPMTFEVPSVEQPEVEAPAEPTVTYEQAAPVMADFAQPAPDFQPAANVAPAQEMVPDVAPVVDNTLTEPAPEAPTVAESVTEPAAPTAPTLPIPDQMPMGDYQATVSTPVDYATPMSDFDQIGSTPELNPKEKSKKTNYKKTFLFCLLIILIAALGGGAYYLINIKGIFNSKGVVTKDITVNTGDKLSTVISDYGTFKNTSATNCILDTSKVNVDKAGKYTYTIKCGNDTYQGNVIVKDNEAPILTFKIKGTMVDIPVILKEFLAKELKEDETLGFTDEAKFKESLKTTGMKIVSFTASDEAGNKQIYYAPLAVLSKGVRLSIIANKVNQEDASNERIIVICNEDTVCEAGFKAQIIKFDTLAEFKEVFKSYKGESSFTFKNYTGVPLFDIDELTLAIITESNIELNGKPARTVFDEYTTQGYDTDYSTSSGIDQNKINLKYMN